MKIEVIIPNYNGYDLISKNLPYVLNVISKYKNIALTFVDDGSDKEDYSRTLDYIENTRKKYDLEIKLIRLDKNRGFSYAVNKGVFASNADLVVLLNTDVKPENKFLDFVLKDFLLNKDLFGVGCLDKSEEGKEIVLKGRGVGVWNKGFMQHSKGEVNKNNTFWVSGGSSILKRDIFEKLGGFDELYNPFYWEDIDLSFRAQKTGYRVIFEKESAVIHEHSKGSIIKHYNTFQIKSIAYKNQFIFVWKNITDLNLIISHLMWLPYHFATAVLRKDTAFFNGFFLARVLFTVMMFNSL